MNSYIQLLCLIVSFGYGCLLYISNRFNERLLNNKGILVRIIGNILYINNMALLYVCFLYKVNFGILHIYFVMFIIAGYAFMSVKKRK